MQALLLTKVPTIRKHKLSISQDLVIGWLRNEFYSVLPSEILQMIVEFYGLPTDPNSRLIGACCTGNIGIAKKALMDGADPGHPIQLVLGYTAPFFISVVNGHIPIVKLFVDRDVRIIDRNYGHFEGSRALHLAAANNDQKMCQFLINHGAQVNKTKYLGITPMMEAASTAYIDVIRLLLENNADINAEDYERNSALSYCLEHVTTDESCPYYECAAYLVQNGANPNYPARYCPNRTLFDCAVARGALNTCRYLIEMADMWLSPSEIEFYTQYATANGFNDIAEYLKTKQKRHIDKIWLMSIISAFLIASFGILMLAKVFTANNAVNISVGSSLLICSCVFCYFAITTERTRVTYVL